MSDSPEVDVANQSSTAPPEFKKPPESNATATPSAKPKQQWCLGLIYLTALLFCFVMAIHYSDHNFKIALGWIVAGIVASQVVVDLGKFSSPESKARFSALFRTAGGLFALVVAYLL